MHHALQTRPLYAADSEPGSGPAPEGTGTAHAKAILFGEHAVVYGAPAIALPLDRLEAHADVWTDANGTSIESSLLTSDAGSASTHIEPLIAAVRASAAHIGAPEESIRLRIRSSIPHGLGLGSSAAVATAIARAVAAAAGLGLDREQSYAIAQAAERVAHGNPSGIDARAVASAAPIRFQDGTATEVRIGQPLAFVIADSGLSGSTAEAVAGVRALRAERPSAVDAIIARLTEITDAAPAALDAGDRAAIGADMLEAHRLLADLGVSTPELDRLVAAATAAGAVGAKLTGGGLGGCVLALADSPEQAERIADELGAAGAYRTWTTTVAQA